MKSKSRPDWGRLHAKLRDVYLSHGAGRMAAALESFSGRKESICRKLGVVCEADLSRIASKMKAEAQTGTQ